MMKRRGIKSRIDIMDPRTPRWIFWLVTFLICAIIGIAIGMGGILLANIFLY